MTKIIASIIFLCLPSCVNAEECKKEVFDTFVSTFFANIHEAVIKFPFKTSNLIDGKYEPKQVERIIESDNSEEAKKLLNRGYTLAIKRRAIRKQLKISEFEHNIKFLGPDSGFLIVYHFQSIGGCWNVVKFEDSST